MFSACACSRMPRRPAEAEPSASNSEAQYCLTDPKSLAEYLNHANIRLVRAEYLYELAKTKRTLPRRQEAEEWGLVTHEEVRAWAAGTLDAMICSVSHAWESREHPDPCGSQLKCLVDVVSLFDAAYFSKIWLFYDYVSLFQFKREGQAEEESFRRSMRGMHVLYAHQCTRTFRIESLTVDDVWAAALANSEYRVRVYDEASNSVRDRPLKELVANRELYRNRGWCKAEVEWSLARSKSGQNHWIDAPESQEDEEELLGKVPMAPEIFAEEMNSAAFTHRSDGEEVKKLQFKVFLQKVAECEAALFQYLPEGQLWQLARALPYYQKLRVLRLLKVHVGRSDAEAFAEALASNETIRELDIRLSPDGRLGQAIGEALKTNSTLTSIHLCNNIFDDFDLILMNEGGKVIAEALKTNSTLTSIHLARISIGSEAGKAIAEALKTNSTLKDIVLSRSNIGVEGGKAIAEALKSNSVLTSINLQDSSIGVEGGKAIAEALKSNSTLTWINLKSNSIGDEGGKAIGEALKSNSVLTSISLECNRIGNEGGKAIAEALKSNSTLTSIDLECNRIGNEGGKAIAEAFKTNSMLTSIHLERNMVSREVIAELAEIRREKRKRFLLLDAASAEAPSSAMAAGFAGTAWTGRVRIEVLAKRLNAHCNRSWLSLSWGGIGVEGGKAIAQALKTNSTLNDIDLSRSNIGMEGGKAIAEALKSNSVLTSINLEDTSIGVEGGKAVVEALNTNCMLTSINLAFNRIGGKCGKAIGEALETNSTLTSINLQFNSIGNEGVQAIAEALKSNSTLTSIDFEGNRIGDEGGKAIAEALKSNSTLTWINLKSNSIGDEGGKAIGEALKSNSVLTSISLECNRIGNEGGKAIAKALTCSSSELFGLLRRTFEEQLHAHLDQPRKQQHRR